MNDAVAVENRMGPGDAPSPITVDKALKHPGVAYRPDIDGLRAIAVLVVIFFHAHFAWMPGGFVGVDVFFVISGFLITKIIIADIEAERFTYANFYRRRIKRIVPAFAVVVLATAAAGLMLSVPNHLVDLGKSIVASAIAMTNVLFWQQTGYFASASETKPLLHTWSLSVEEQFYFLFPAILILSRRLGTRGPLMVTAAIFLVSLTSALVLVGMAPAFAFFMLPTRAWELMAGSILALEPSLLARRRSSAWLVAAGIAMILAAALLYARDTPFPGLAALLPVAGSALVIAAGGHGDSISSRVLGNKAMVGIGLISYSLYLWHWPLFAFWRYWQMREPTSAEAVLLIGVAFVLSAATFKFVEKPLRSRSRFHGRQPFVWAAVAALVIGSMGLLFVSTGGLPGRFDAQIRRLLDIESYQPHRRSECMSKPGAWRSPSNPCVYGAGVKPSVALWGDSHAYAAVDSLGSELGRRGRSLAFFSYTGCPPVIGLKYGDLSDRCADFTRGTIDYLVRQPSIGTVVIFARHAMYLEGSTEAFGPAEAGVEEIRPMPVPMSGMRMSPLPAAYEDRLRQTVRALRRGGKQVILVLPTPEVPFDVPNTIALRTMRGDEPAFVVPRSMYVQRQRHVIPMLQRISIEENAKLVGITDLICEGRTCNVMRDGKLLYYDDDHLTRYGSDLLAKRLVATMEVPAR